MASTMLCKLRQRDQQLITYTAISAVYFPLDLSIIGYIILTGRTAGTGVELTGVWGQPPPYVPNQAMATLPTPAPVQSLRIQQRSPLSGLLAPEQPAGRRDTSRQNRRETKRGETMEVEERKRTKRDTDGKIGRAHV